MVQYFTVPPYFNPRPPRGGRHKIWVYKIFPLIRFQSTPPARGATNELPITHTGCSNFNPRPPRGGRLPNHGVDFPNLRISIHAPREGGDFRVITQLKELVISIHAPREGGDCATILVQNKLSEFQSTPPARGATTV